MRALNENQNVNFNYLPSVISISASVRDVAADTDLRFNVILKNSGNNKLSVIKVIRELRPDLGLAESKKLADNPPSTVLTDVDKDEANETKKKLEAAGATASVIPSETTLSSSSCPDPINKYSKIKRIKNISLSNIEVEIINNSQYRFSANEDYGGETVYFMSDPLNKNIKVSDLELRNVYEYDDDECKLYTYNKNLNTVVTFTAVSTIYSGGNIKTGQFSFVLPLPEFPFPWRFIVIDINYLNYFYIDVDVNGEVTTGYT
jgi:ribosomal protein L7/L12